MKLQHLGVLLLLGALWGASFMFIKIGGAEMPPDTLVAARLVLGALLLLVVLYGSGQRLPGGWLLWRDFAIVGMVGLIAPFTLITWSEQIIPSGQAAVLNGTAPLFTALIAYGWMRSEHLTGIKLLGVGLGFVGVVIAVGLTDVSFSSAGTQAQLAVLLASLCYGVSGVYSRQAFKGLPALVPATGQLLAGALLLTPVALLRNGLPSTLPSAVAMASVGALAVFGTSIAYILLYWLIERIGATRTSMVTYLVAPMALVYGAVFLREQISANTLVGLGLVIVGILLANGVIALRTQPVAKPV
ncbi:MAG: DMT family transporter [Roseiflexaceae bacterium]|nr:DMT family transporter [Roseiflexaceae bacterium]